jgi:hypothetical protein
MMSNPPTIMGTTTANIHNSVLPSNTVLKCDKTRSGIECEAINQLRKLTIEGLIGAKRVRW